MKKYIFLVLLLSLPILSLAQEPLKASVAKVWTVDTAREEAFRDAKPWIDVSEFPSIDPNLIENKQALSTHKSIIDNRFITVLHVGMLELCYTVASNCSKETYYYFSNGQLGYIERNASPSFSSPECPPQYPQKGYKYEFPSGKLSSISIAPSMQESFRFYPNGTLLTHWVGDKCYLADGSSCGTRTTFEDNK